MFSSLPLKSQATRLGDLLSKHGVVLSRSEKLEALAFVHGAANWQTLRTANLAPSSDGGQAPGAVAAEAHRIDDLAPAMLYGENRDKQYPTLVGETLVQAATRILATEPEMVVWRWDPTHQRFALVAERIVGPADGVVPQVPVYELDGTRAVWEFQHNLSDYEGDFNLTCFAEKPFFGSVPVFAWNQCMGLQHGDSSYIGVLDGQIGVCFEQEYTCREADADEDPEAVLTFDERVSQLCRTHRSLLASYPRVRFAICADKHLTWNGRPAVWAFMPASAVEPEEAKALFKDLLDLAYPPKAD